MAHFANPIFPNDRIMMSIPPPPTYTMDGDIVPYPANVDERYARLRRYKEGNIVYAEDELDTYNHPDETVYFTLLLRCMPNMADLNVILAAAKHIELVSHYRVETDIRTEMSPEFERSFTTVYYEIGSCAMPIDPDFSHIQHHHIHYLRRQQMWSDLFAAAGYRTSWGNALNIRHPK